MASAVEQHPQPADFPCQPQNLQQGRVSQRGFLAEIISRHGERPPLHAVPWVLQAQGCRADLTPSPLLENQTSSNAP